MKQRIFTGWNFARACYAILGIIFIIHSIIVGEWMITLPGIYFAMMGVFSLGCASGNCFVGTGSTNGSKNAPPEVADITFEEVNPK